MLKQIISNSRQVRLTSSSVKTQQQYGCAIYGCVIHSFLFFYFTAITAPKCPNDILVAVDSSACFRDHHRRMMKFLSKLVHRVGREEELEYSGSEGTRLGLMQVRFCFSHYLISFRHLYYVICNFMILNKFHNCLHGYFAFLFG